MALHPLSSGDSFQKFSLLLMNDYGCYIDPGKDLKKFSDAQTIAPDQLPEYLQRKIVLHKGVTDVFVWVHGWRNNLVRARATARCMFNGITEVYRARANAYSHLERFSPAFVAVHWPSMSSPSLSGYKHIRDRARQLTDSGDAEFFLASLLGYLDAKNTREGGTGSKVLKAAGGFYVHCLGHSFGGRFLTAAIRAAATPQSPQTRKLLGQTGAGARKLLSAEAAKRFQFTVDSALIFQMAAPNAGFGTELSQLVHAAPLHGPLVLTHSDSDRANCFWHRKVESEAAIGCSGALEPRQEIANISLRDLDYQYSASDFRKNIVNVDASWAFARGVFRVEGAHSDFWYKESVHLILSLVNYTHSAW